jgi:phosphoadenosine phosphosulfate reductase
LLEKSKQLIEWALKEKSPAITTTSFGEYSAVLLHMVTEISPSAKVVWVDTQFNTDATLKFKTELCERLRLDLSIHLGAQWEYQPSFETPEYDNFVEQVKLNPFRFALRDLNAKSWITGIRREETKPRQNATYVDRTGKLIKVSPLLDWTTKDLDEYLDMYDLPREADYYDPTKRDPDCECGIHTIEL